MRQFATDEECLCIWINFPFCFAWMILCANFSLLWFHDAIRITLKIQGTGTLELNVTAIFTLRKLCCLKPLSSDRDMNIWCQERTSKLPWNSNLYPLTSRAFPWRSEAEHDIKLSDASNPLQIIIPIKCMVLPPMRCTTSQLQLLLSELNVVTVNTF